MTQLQRRGRSRVHTRLGREQPGRDNPGGPERSTTSAGARRPSSGRSCSRPTLRPVSRRSSGSRTSTAATCRTPARWG